MAGFMAFGGQTAQAATPSCGDTLTSNVTFKSDLDCSSLTGSAAAPVAALTVGADNVTINLNGHSITGPDSVIGICPAFFSSTTNRIIGILVDGFDHTNILNGAVNDFEFGIMVKNASDVSIRNIETDNNAFNGVNAGDADGVLPSAVGGVHNLVLNRVNIHDTHNDGMAVSQGSHATVMNGWIVDNCASGAFVWPKSLFGTVPADRGGHADFKNNQITGNFRSAINYWGVNSGDTPQPGLLGACRTFGVSPLFSTTVIF